MLEYQAGMVGLARAIAMLGPEAESARELTTSKFLRQFLRFLTPQELMEYSFTARGDLAPTNTSEIP